MAAYYLDSSALVKRYIAEPGSLWIRHLTNPGSGHFLYTGVLAGPEMLAAIVRRARGGQLSPSAALRGVTNVRRDWHNLYTILEIDEQVVVRAMDIAELHGLRGYDAVHVATALVLRDERQARTLPPLTFVSADQDQLRVAAGEGLMIEDPNQHR